MSELQWYSARLKRICLVEGGGARLAMKTVHVFRASDWHEAFERAVALGRAMDEEYRSADGAVVKWRLKEVETLDVLPGESMDGAEVHSEFADLTTVEQELLETDLRPESSTPNESLGGVPSKRGG